MEESNNTQPVSEEKAMLTPQEALVLAVLMEKQLATPKYYPLTPNALTTACNQKSSREPVMDLSEGEVRHLSNLLENRGLLQVDSGERTYRISHRVKQYFELNRSELAVLAVLMLRNPQTLNDILRRTARMVEFEDVEKVQLVVEEMIDREHALAVVLPRRAGCREDRYWHTLCGKLPEEPPEISAPEITTLKDDGNQRIDLLEERLDVLESRLEDVLKKIGKDVED